MSVPTDCPQRDERRGWSGDAALSADETLFNFDFYGFYTSWLVQWRIEQGDDGSINDIVPDDGGGRPADPNCQLSTTHNPPAIAVVLPTDACCLLLVCL